MKLFLLRLACCALFATAVCVAARGAEAETLTPSALLRRGMEQFRAGEIQKSIDDFNAVARLVPDRKAELWQLGISLYYAGEFAKGRDLFELHQTVNTEDVENAVWHFLCAARLDGVEKAREKLIPIARDGRVPMKEVHGLFAGKMTADEVLKAAQAGAPGEAELKNRLCYAHLYLGLYEEALGRANDSLEHMKKAAGEYRQEHYMGDVARVHLKLREAAAGGSKTEK